MLRKLEETFLLPYTVHPASGTGLSFPRASRTVSGFPQTARCFFFAIESESLP